MRVLSLSDLSCCWALQGVALNPFTCNVQLSESGAGLASPKPRSNVNELLAQMKLGPLKPPALGGKAVVALNMRAGALQL